MIAYGTMGAVFRPKDLPSGWRKIARESIKPVVLESAKEVLHDNDYDIKESNIKVKGELLTNLFAVFKKEDFSGNSYLPNHEVVAKFRDRLYDLLRESKQRPDNLSKILFDF